jgi:hypothetical protein
MARPTGFILYRGPSLIDGAPIVVIALTGKSKNVKTGALMQTYILRADMEPLAAIREGSDSSICGACPHRGGEGRKRSCYVNVGQGATMVYRAFLRGRYPDISGDVSAIREIGWGRRVRLGTYGDPAAAPALVWQALVADAEGNTGYTHQIANAALSIAQRHAIAQLCMVSADTPEDAQRARDSGFRYFRIRLETEALGEREFVCPASAEGGKRMLCADCMACSGSSKGKSSPVIIAHGSLKRNYRTFRLQAV